MPLRTLKQRYTRKASSTAYTQEDNLRNTNTGKHATPRDEMYKVVARSQIRQAFEDRWFSFTGMKWDGKEQRICAASAARQAYQPGIAAEKTRLKPSRMNLI